MTGEFFTFDNGRDRRRVDYDQFLLNLSGIEESPEKVELWKLFSLFDTDGSGKIDTDVEANELFGFIREKAAENGILEEQELRDWIASCQNIEEGERDNIFAAARNLMNLSESDAQITYDDNNRIVKEEHSDGSIIEYLYHDDENPPCVEITMNNGNKYFISELNKDGAFNANSRIYKKIENGIEKEYIYHDDEEPQYVEIKDGNTTYLVNKVNALGLFTSEDFISKTYTDAEGRNVTVGKYRVNVQGEDIDLISESVELENNKVLTTVYNTLSYYDYNYAKATGILGDEGISEIIQIYQEGENEYSVCYNNDNNTTITHPASGDGVYRLVRKFDFDNPAQFYELNPDLRPKRNGQEPVVHLSDPIAVPGHLAANDPRILRQGTMQSEYGKYQNAMIAQQREEIRSQYFPNISSDVFNALQEIEGFKISDENMQMYTKINAMDVFYQTMIADDIKYYAETPKEDGTFRSADEIKREILETETYGEDFIPINLFDGFLINLHSHQNAEYPVLVSYTPNSAGGADEDYLISIKDYFILMGLDPEGDDKNLYNQLCNYQYSVQDENDVEGLERLSHDIQDITVMLSVIYDRYKGLDQNNPKINQQTAGNMLRAVITKITSPNGNDIRTDYDAFIEDYRDTYVREYATQMFYMLSMSNQAMLQAAIDSKDILHILNKKWDKNVLAEQRLWDDRHLKQLSDGIYLGNRSFGEAFSATFKQEPTLSSASVPYSRNAIKQCAKQLEEYDRQLTELNRQLSEYEAQLGNAVVANASQIREKIGEIHRQQVELQDAQDLAIVRAFGGSIPYQTKALIHWDEKFEGAVEMGIMLVFTEVIGVPVSFGGKLLGKGFQMVFPRIASRAGALVTGGSRFSAFLGKALPYIGGAIKSGITFGIYDGAREYVRYTTNGIDEMTLDNPVTLGQSVWGSTKKGFGFGLFMGAVSPLLRGGANKITGKIFGMPVAEDVSRTALENTTKALKGSAGFTGSKALETSQRALASAGAMSPGAEMFSQTLNFVFEVGAFSAYDITTALLTGEKPDYMDWGEYAATVLGGQIKGLLEIKTIAYLLSSHRLNNRAAEIFPDKLKPEQDLYFTRSEENGVTVWKTTINGKEVTARNMNEVLFYSNWQRQQVLIYDPIEQLLTESGGTLDIGEGMQLIKNGNRYEVVLPKGKKVNGASLREALDNANKIYSYDVSAATLQKKGEVKIGNHVFRYDRTTQKVTITCEGREVSADNLSEAMAEVAKIETCKDYTERMGNKSSMMLAQGLFLQTTEGGKLKLVQVTPYGEYIESGEFSRMEDVVDYLFNPTPVVQGSSIATQAQMHQHKVTITRNGQNEEVDATTVLYRTGRSVSVEIDGKKYTYVYGNNSEKPLAIFMGGGESAKLAGTTAYSDVKTADLRAELDRANENGEIPQRNAIIAELRERGYEVELLSPDVENDGYITSFNDGIRVYYPTSPIPPGTGNNFIDPILTTLRENSGNYTVQRTENGNTSTVKLLSKSSGKVIYEITEYKDAQNNTTRVEVAEYEYLPGSENPHQKSVYKPEGTKATTEFSTSDGRVIRESEEFIGQTRRNLVDAIAAEGFYDADYMDYVPAEQNTGVRKNASVGENQAQQPVNQPAIVADLKVLIAPQFETQLHNIQLQTQRPPQDIDAAAVLMERYPNWCNEISELLISNPNIKVGYEVNNNPIPQIDNIMSAIAAYPQFKNAIMDYMKVQRRATHDTTDPTAQLEIFIRTLQEFPRQLDFIMALSQNHNLEANNIWEITSAINTGSEAIKPEDVNNILMLSRNNYTQDGIIRTLEIMHKYPQMAATMSKEVPSYRLIDPNPENTPDIIRNKRLAKRNEIQEVAPHELNKLRKTLGDDYYNKICWEEIIPDGTSQDQIVQILEDLNYNSKFFARTSVNEGQFGKNIQWAAQMGNIAESATVLMQNGATFDDVISYIASEYRAQDEANTFNSNVATEPRRLYSGVSRLDPSLSGDYGWTGTEPYVEYNDRLPQASDNGKRTYNEIDLTNVLGNIMYHPHKNYIDPAMDIVRQHYNELAPLFEKVAANQELLPDEVSFAHEKISEMYFLMANVMPWHRGSNGICDLFMRSLYESLGIDQPALKRGVSLDLEAFTMDITEYKQKWPTFFENSDTELLEGGVRSGDLTEVAPFARRLEQPLGAEDLTSQVVNYRTVINAEPADVPGTGVVEMHRTSERTQQIQPVDNTSVDAITPAVSAGEGTRTPAENNVVSGTPAVPAQFRASEQGPIKFRENAAVTPDAARRMLIEAGFPESELSGIDFNNPNVLFNAPLILYEIKLNIFDSLKDFDITDNSARGIDRRQELYEALKENMFDSEDSAGIAKYLNEDNINLLKKYCEFSTEKDLKDLMRFFIPGGHSEISERILQMLPAMTNNGQRKLTVDEFKNLRYVDDSLIPYLTPDRAQYVENINSQIEHSDFKIKIFDFNLLGSDENLTEDFANRYVAAAKRLTEWHIDSTHEYNVSKQQELARMERIVEFFDRYEFDLGGTDDNWLFASDVEKIMARTDIAELQEYFRNLVPEARRFGLNRLPKEGLSFKDYADLCNYLTTEPNLFDGNSLNVNKDTVMRFVAEQNITDIKGFTELIKSLKGTNILMGGSESTLNRRLENIPDQQFVAASKVIDELKLMYSKPEAADDLSQVLIFVFGKFSERNIEGMAQKMQYMREHNIVSDCRDNLLSLLDTDAPEVVEKYELLLSRGIKISSLSRRVFENLILNENLSKAQLSAAIDSCFAKVNEYVLQKFGTDVVARLGRQRFDEIVKEILILPYADSMIDLEVMNYSGISLNTFVDEQAAIIFNPSAIDVFDKYWGNPDCKVSHKFIKTMAKYAKDVPESEIEAMYKVLADAKMKKNQIKTFDEDLTDDDLEHFFIANFKEIGMTIDMIGIPAFEYSYTSKLAGMQQLVDCVKNLSEHYFYNPEILEHIAARLSDKTIEPQDRISKVEILAGLSNCSSPREMEGFINLIKPSTPADDEVTFAKNLWNNQRFWSSEGDFTEKFEQKLSEFCDYFGVDKNDRKIRDFFEKRITTDAKGNRTHKGVKDSEIKSFLEKNIIRKRNQAEWNDAIYRKVFDFVQLEYSPDVATKLNIIDSPYLGSVFQGNVDFKNNFRIMLERLAEHPELSVAETFDQLPQNIETRRQFGERNIPYDRFVNADMNSYKTVRIVFNAETAKADAVKNFTKEFNDIAFKSLPKDETDKIIKALEEIGIKTETISVPEYDGDGFLIGQTEAVRFVDANNQPITFDNLKRMISAINGVMNENSFWTTRSTNATLQNHKDTFYSHITKDRSQEIDNALSIRGERVVELEIHQTDMNNLKMALFLGNGLCCTGVGSGCNQFSAPTYVMNKCISAIEIKDGKNVVGNTMCYFAEVDGQLALILDNIEVLPGYQGDVVRNAFMDYAKQFCAEMGLSNIPIYAGPNRHKFTMEGVYQCQPHNMKIIGSTGEDEIYHDGAGPITVDGNSVIENIKLFLIYDGKSPAPPAGSGDNTRVNAVSEGGGEVPAARNVAEVPGASASTAASVGTTFSADRDFTAGNITGTNGLPQNTAVTRPAANPAAATGQTIPAVNNIVSGSPSASTQRPAISGENPAVARFLSTGMLAFWTENNPDLAREFDEKISQIIEANPDETSVILAAFEHYCQGASVKPENFRSFLNNRAEVDSYIKAYRYVTEKGYTGAKIVFSSGELDDVNVQSNHFVVFDRNGNFIKHEQHRRVIRGGVDTYIETVNTPDGRIEYTAEMDGETMKQSSKKIFDLNGNLKYTEYYVASETLPGQYNVFREYPGGNREQVGVAERDASGNVNIIRTINYDNDYHTDYSYNENADGHQIGIVIKDNNGNALLDYNFEFKVIDDNHFETHEEGAIYDIQYTENEVIVTKDGNEQVRISIGDNAKDADGVISRDLVPMLKKMPGSFYFNIDKFNLYKIGLELDKKAKSSDYSLGVINILSTDQNSTFVVSHEYNHFLIDRILKINVESAYDSDCAAKSPNSPAKPMNDVIREAFQILCIPDEVPYDADAKFAELNENYPETFKVVAGIVNTDLLQAYVEERAEFLRNQTAFEAGNMTHLLNKNSYRKTDILCSMEEMASDVRAFLYAPNNADIRLRGYFMMEHFPKTFAMMANMILHNVEYSKMAKYEEYDLPELQAIPIPDVATETRSLLGADAPANGKPVEATSDQRPVISGATPAVTRDVTERTDRPVQVENTQEWQRRSSTIGETPATPLVRDNTTGRKENARRIGRGILGRAIDRIRGRKAKKEIMQNTVFPLKDPQDLQKLGNMLDNLIDSGFDLSLIDHNYQYHYLIKVAKECSDPDKFIESATNVLIENQDNIYVIKTLSKLIENATYNSNNILPADAEKLVTAIYNSEISSEHLFSILNKRQDNMGAKTQGDPLYLQHQGNFSSQNWESLSKLLPFFAKLDPKSNACTYATEIVRCADDLMRIHQVQPAEKTRLLNAIENIPENILFEMQATGVNIIGLRDYLRFYNANQNISVEHTVITNNFGIVFAKNSENLFNNPQMNNFISANRNTGLPLNYSRRQFIQEFSSSLERLSSTERDLLLRQMGISVSNGDFNGIINPDRINVEEFSLNIRPVIEDIRSKAKRFVRENSVTIENPELTTFINGLIEFCPEFVSMIGKPVAGSDKTLDMYVLEVFNNVLSDPKYNELSDIDKYILKWSVLMHAVGQTTDVTDIALQYKMSARMANDLTKKYNLLPEVKQRVMNQISNGAFWSTGERDINKYFRTENDLNLAVILAGATTEARGIEDFNKYFYGDRYSGQVNYALNNPMAKEKYPKYRYEVDGQVYEIPVLDVRNMDPETDMTQYGYVGMKLKDITVQVHHTTIYGLRQIPEFYDDPNYYDAYSTSIRNIQHTDNGYGGIGFVFSTARMNKGGGRLDWKERGVGDLDDFQRQIYVNGAKNSMNGHEGILYPGQIEDPAARQAWLDNAHDASTHRVNEVFALKPMPEQIELSGYDFTPDNIPIEYVRVSVQNGCMPILLTNQ